MIKSQIFSLKFLFILLLCLMMFTPCVAIEINSEFRHFQPMIDCDFYYREWDISNKVEFEHGFIAVANDAVRLYILIDVMGDDVAEVISADVPGDQEDAVQEAADDCPAEAIAIS